MIALIEIYQIDREQNSHSMNPPRRDDPKTFVEFESQFANQTFQARKCRIRSRNA
jgi:hypothetical protein